MKADKWLVKAQKLYDECESYGSFFFHDVLQTLYYRIRYELAKWRENEE